MERFQRELRRHITQYNAIQGSEWKKITNHIIKQYQKIDSPPFNMGFNMLVVTDPLTTHTKYRWLRVLPEWTNSTRHDLITRNLWPKPEITTSQELNAMPMLENNGGPTSIHGNPREQQQNRIHGQIRLQIYNTKININRSNRRSIQHKSRSIPF
jgi:hypothetical protein